MSGFRLILLTAMAMVFVGAFASASASATTPVFSVCLKGTGGSGTKYEESNCEKTDAGGAWELVEIKEALAISGTSGVAKLKGVTSESGNPYHLQKSQSYRRDRTRRHVKSRSHIRRM